MVVPRPEELRDVDRPESTDMKTIDSKNILQISYLTSVTNAKFDIWLENPDDLQSGDEVTVPYDGRMYTGEVQTVMSPRRIVVDGVRRLD